jgi:type I restriction enzyme, R subunit
MTNKPTDTTEKGLEAHITQYLTTENGFILRGSKDYNNVSCMDEALLFDFLEATQSKQVAKLKAFHKDLWQQKIVKKIQDKITDPQSIKGKPSGGILNILRKGIEDGHTGIKLDLFYDKPVSTYNTETQKLYEANQFSVIRQVYFSPQNRKSLDMVVFVNGLPVMSFELKNELTNQTVEHAINQYKSDRDPHEELFRLGRLVVNFAVDTEQVYMCTHLQKEKSYFLPFNKGDNNGAGNPNNGGIKTDYLWKQILTKASLTNILQSFAQFTEEEKEHIDSKGKTKTHKVRKMIFPRYHQLTAVRELLDDASAHGAGQKYLIQHSAGSGKSNSISWLAHQLVSLHDKSGRDNVFDSVIVVTDRKVLDAQIQANVRQFEQVTKLVQPITEGSKQLKEALEEGKKIIITTIQKFPRIVEDIGELPGNHFAIIIDEAHSSLSGQMARKLNETLSKVTDEEELKDDMGDYDEEENDTVTGEDLIRVLIKSRKLLTNASYFAFTATPKNKTLELFGVPYTEGGVKTKFKAFHLYSMKQAIDEGFIKDVLQNYTTFKSYYALLKKVEDDPEYDKKKAEKKLRAYVESHEQAIKKKTVIAVQHFMDKVVKAKRMGGLAKAMLVTSSRKNAVEYKKAFDAYLKSINSPYKAIVAFSGEIDGDTEAKLNGFSSTSIPAEFEKSDNRFLIVANKYQTGFDQPLLHTMYVDKKLGGVNAVQTLSRLNRSHPQKQETFVLDFANETDDIEKAFKPYFESTILGEATDPNKLYNLKDALDAFQVYDREQVEAFSDKILAGESIDQLHDLLDTATEVFKGDLSEDEQIDFRAKVKTYVRLYVFLSQIVEVQNPYMERLYIFLNHLQNKLGSDPSVDLAKGILNNIDMDSYRLQLQATISMVMEQGEDLKPMPTEMRGGGKDVEMDRLSNIIQSFNEKYKGDFPDFEIVHKTVENVGESVAQKQSVKDAITHTPDNASITIEKELGDAILSYNNGNFDLMKKFFDDKEFKADLLHLITARVMQTVFNQPRV